MKSKCCIEVWSWKYHNNFWHDCTSSSPLILRNGSQYSCCNSKTLFISSIRIHSMLISTHNYFSNIFDFSEVEPLLQMAADNGVDEAKKALQDLYPHKYPWQDNSAVVMMNTILTQHWGEYIISLSQKLLSQSKLQSTL